MNIEELINQYPRFSQHIGLDRISLILEALELKKAPFPYIHIAGTKGKGSTAVFLANIMKAAGYKAGLFTSPHLQNIHERICIDLIPISSPRLEALYKKIHHLIQELKLFDLSYFELMTAIALLEFHVQKTDIVILETGLGGRLDATNAVSNPALTILTNISLDHIDRLGPDLISIATEKAAIIKNGAPIISAPQAIEVARIIQDKALLEKVRYHCIYRDYEISSYPSSGFEKERFDVLSYITGLPYTHLNIALAGKHQTINATLALASAELLTKKGFIIKEKHIRQGLMKASWPGRFELLKVNNCMVLMDGAHNPDSSLALVSTLKERFPEKNIHMLFATLGTKLVEQNLKNLSTIAKSFYFTSMEGHAAVNPRELQDWTKQHLPDIPSYCESDGWKCFIRCINDRNPQKDLICITGSLYYIGQIRNKLHLPFYLENGKDIMEVSYE